MNILVTGCSRGVGLEICRVLLEEGHVVYGVSRSYSNEFRILEEKYESKPVSYTHLTLPTSFTV